MTELALASEERTHLAKVEEQLREALKRERDLEGQRDSFRDKLVAEQQAKEAALSAHADVAEQHEFARRRAGELRDKAARAEVAEQELAAAKAEIAALIERVGGLTRGVEEAEAKAAGLADELANERSARAEAEAKASANDSAAQAGRDLAAAIQALQAS